MHLVLCMYKQKSNGAILNVRNVCTQAHDAALFTTDRPNSEKYKNNVLYKGATLWNSQPVQIRNIQTYEILKTHLKDKSLRETIPNRGQ